MTGQSYNMGYYYDRVKRGDGWTVEAGPTRLGGSLIFHGCTKASADNLKSELKKDGYNEVTIEKG